MTGDTHALGFYSIAERGAFGYIAELMAECDVGLEDVTEGMVEGSFGAMFDLWLDDETRVAVAAFRARHDKRAPVN